MADKNTKTEVSNVTPEELLSRIKTIVQSLIEETLTPKPESYVGVPEISKYCNESTSWVYGKCSDNFLPHYKTAKNASLKFKISEVAKVMESYKVECEYKKHFQYTVDNQGNIIK